MNVYIFMKIDLRWVCHYIRIKKGDKWKGVFKIREGLFKPMVLQFRFINAPATFQRRINHVLKEHLDEFVMAYLDNIIIYLNTKEEHKEHIKWVLKRLYDKNIPIVMEKYKFHIKKTDFVGFIIKPGQINIDLKKVEAIVNWQDLENII